MQQVGAKLALGEDRHLVLPRRTTQSIDAATLCETRGDELVSSPTAAEASALAISRHERHCGQQLGSRVPRYALARSVPPVALWTAPSPVMSDDLPHAIA